MQLMNKPGEGPLQRDLDDNHVATGTSIQPPTTFTFIFCIVVTTLLFLLLLMSLFFCCLYCQVQGQCWIKWGIGGELRRRRKVAPNNPCNSNNNLAGNTQQQFQNPPLNSNCGFSVDTTHSSSSSTTSSTQMIPKQSIVCLRIGDLLICMCITFPLVIGVWRGVWELMENYCSLLISMVLGYLTQFIFYLLQEPLKRHVVPGKVNGFTFYFVSRATLILHGIGVINQWRGWWEWLDEQLGSEPLALIIPLLIGGAINLLFRTFRNSLGPPVFSCLDSPSTLYDCPIRFQSKTDDKFRYLCDTAFSVLLVPSLTICQWRGLWELCDRYIYPQDAALSAITTMAIGYSICITLCVFQPLTCKFLCSLKGTMKVIVADMFSIAGYIGVVIAWRGVWISYDVWLIFDTPELSQWVSATVGIVVLTLLGSVSSIIVRGALIDGDIGEEDEWLIPYISKLYHSSPTPSHSLSKDEEDADRMGEEQSELFEEPWLFRCLFTTKVKPNLQLRINNIKSSNKMIPSEKEETYSGGSSNSSDSDDSSNGEGNDGRSRKKMTISTISKRKDEKVSSQLKVNPRY